MNHQPPKQHQHQHSNPTRTQILAETLRNKSTLLTSLFILSYQGAEVALGGWIVSLLMSARGGDAATVGYVASGFCGGIALGRFILSGLCGAWAERRAVVALLAGTVGMEILVCLVPNVIGRGMSVALAGFFTGLDGARHTRAQWTSSPACSRANCTSPRSPSSPRSGRALWPFTAGFIAQFKGPFVVHPAAIGSCVLMEVLWLLLPKVPKRAI
ncbi:hypothetical protein GLOTRDRAFT_131414 [Gloeophyllum trabeum ATCC 11539]|uniref:Major facilitator superfamily (MFS) profile domain-containing protein n=1 Tax=Gloeophyllum trabeum (strain ATCC 11539 / FP-39264 / Madison 617) TaxID=670483 RepID=S7RKE2_GLOTA|nr:uncharacterized protein GLOTRDRAFT_131414 [Gloeophyllum trabeum ATCC 11539]EPQ53129.1 hypothetical protein GLOTRDRAFT_131414 [Gloeophyllum trabeum ATCC 11539]